MVPICSRKPKDAFSLYITPKPGRDAEAVTAVMKEVKRLKDFGVTGTELLRARDNFLSTYETLYNNRDKQKNGYYVERCVRDFLDGRNGRHRHALQQLQAPFGAGE